MQDLRDKLKKAGLISKKQAREAKTEIRRAQKAQGNREAASHAEKEKKEKYESKLAEQAVKAREVQAELNQEQKQKEARNRIRNLIQSHTRQKILGEDRPFYFMGRDRFIRRLMTTYEIASQLALGHMAIVEIDYDPIRDFALIDAATAGRVEELDKSLILFWNKPDQPNEDLPFYGSGN